jgi:hypothetical protein
MIPVSNSLFDSFLGGAKFSGDVLQVGDNSHLCSVISAIETVIRGEGVNASSRRRHH